MGANGRAWDEPPLDLPTPTPDAIAGLTTAAIERADARIASAIDAAEDDAAHGRTPTFEALFGAFDDAAREVGIAFGLGAAHGPMAADDGVREAAFAANEQIERWRADLPARERLAAAVGRFIEGTDLATLDDTDRRYVERWRKDIRLAGGDLAPGQRAEMTRLTNRLLELGTAFYQNLAQPPRITARRDEIADLPEPVRAAAIPVEGDPETVELPVTGGVYLPVMQESANRDLRRRAYVAWTNKGYPGNVPVLEEIVEIRRRLAAIAGYPSWQAYRAENLAAPDAAFMNRFIDETGERLQPAIRRELDAMQAILRGEPGAPPDLRVQEFDWRHADHLQRAALGADETELRRSFELESVIEGLGALSAEIFGIRLEAHPERQGWDPGVRPYDLVDVRSEAVLARLYFDPWARPGKQPGAWMEILMPGGGRHGEGRPAVISLCTNLAPVESGPVLMPPVEVETLFHEYGHVMNYAAGSGRFVVHRPQWIAFDFIEGPSEFLGRWGLRPAVVARYARHHATGEPISSELVEALVRTESLNAAFDLVWILWAAKLDALLHGETPISVDEALRAAWRMRGTPLVDDTHFAAGYSHIAAGTYDAASYGYAWSEIIRDDLLERWEADGLLSSETGARYRQTILEVSWIDDPVAAVNAFLGRPWSIDAFLRRIDRD